MSRSQNAEIAELEKGLAEIQLKGGPKMAAKALRAAGYGAAVAGSVVCLERDEVESPAYAATRAAVLDELQRRLPDVLIVEVVRLSPVTRGNALPTQAAESTAQTTSNTGKSE